MRLALWALARIEGRVLWLCPDWSGETLHMQAVRSQMAPARLVFGQCARREDLLWAAEEALRSGAGGAVVVEMPDPPPLVAVRRLHLAAEASGHGALTLVLTPAQGGAVGVETRFALEAAHHAGQGRWRLTRLRARMAPVQSWDVTCSRDLELVTHRL